MPWWGWLIAGGTTACLVFWLAIRGWTSQDLRQALGQIRERRRKNEEGIRDAEREELGNIDNAERMRLQQLQENHDAKIKEVAGRRVSPDAPDLAQRIDRFLARIRGR